MDTEFYSNVFKLVFTLYKKQIISSTEKGYLKDEIVKGSDSMLILQMAQLKTNLERMRALREYLEQKRTRDYFENTFNSTSSGQKRTRDYFENTFNSMSPFLGSIIEIEGEEDLDEFESMRRLSSSIYDLKT